MLLRSGRTPYLCLWTIPLLALVWEDGIWSGNVLSSVVLGCVLRDTRIGLASIAPICHSTVGSCHCPGAPTQPSGEGHFTQYHDGGEDGGGGGTSVSVNNIRTQAPWIHIPYMLQLACTLVLRWRRNWARTGKLLRITRVQARKLGITIQDRKGTSP